MTPQKAIEALKQILDDLNSDENFLTTKLVEVNRYSHAIIDKTDEILSPMGYSIPNYSFEEP